MRSLKKKLKLFPKKYMNNYDKDLKKNFNNFYKNSKYNYQRYISNFFKSRLKFKKKIEKKKKISKIYRDQTLKELMKIAIIEKKNKKINLYYKKFSHRLNLKSKYSEKGLSLSSNNTNFNSYIYLGHLLTFSNEINEIQKLNAILKILDKLYININKCEILDKQLLLNLITFEKKLIKKLNVKE